jgi:hypothetical protein
VPCDPEIEGAEESGHLTRSLDLRVTIITGIPGISSYQNVQGPQEGRQRATTSRCRATWLDQRTGKQQADTGSACNQIILAGPWSFNCRPKAVSVHVRCVDARKEDDVVCCLIA